MYVRVCLQWNIGSRLGAKYPKIQMLLLDYTVFTLIILFTTSSHVKPKKVINGKDTKKGEKERMSTFHTRDKKKTNI